MYDIIADIIDHSWIQGDTTQQYVMYVCCVLIPVLTVVLIDTVRDVFRGFLNRRR